MTIRIHYKDGACCTVDYILGSLANFMDSLECDDCVNYYTIEGRNPLPGTRWHKWRPNA